MYANKRKKIKNIEKLYTNTFNFSHSFNFLRPKSYIPRKKKLHYNKLPDRI